MRSLVSLFLIFLLFTISPLACLETPDPIWLAGYYDGGDQDEAIANLELQHLSAAEILAVYVSPSVASVPLPLPFAEPMPPERARRATSTRAPPIA